MCSPPLPPPFTQQQRERETETITTLTVKVHNITAQLSKGGLNAAWPGRQCSQCGAGGVENLQGSCRWCGGGG